MPPVFITLAKGVLVAMAAATNPSGTLRTQNWSMVLIATSADFARQATAAGNRPIVSAIGTGDNRPNRHQRALVYPGPDRDPG